MSPPASSTGGSSYGDVDVLSPAGLDALKTRLGARPRPSPSVFETLRGSSALGRHPLTSSAPPSLAPIPPEHDDWRARVDGMRALTAALELPPAPDPDAHPASSAATANDAALDDSLEATPDAAAPDASADASADDPPPPPPLNRAVLVQFRHKCARLLADQLAHLRGDVVAAACASVSALADRAAADPSLRPLVSPLCADVFAPQLLRLMCREGDRASADRGHMAMTRCVAASREPNLARRLTSALAGPGRASPARTRARVFDHLARALADWPAESLMTCRADIERAMMTCVSDESVDVRRGARACFDVYAATWPKRAERVVETASPRARQLLLAGVLEAPEENGRWAKGEGGVDPNLERAVRRGARDDFSRDALERDPVLDDDRDDANASEDADVASRMLTSAAAEASRAPIAASAPVAWARDPAADAPAPAPPRPLFEKQPDEIRARTLAEIREEGAEAEKKPLAAYYAARRARGDATRSEIHPHTAMDDFHEEAALARDVDALNARLREAHAASVHRRATQTYIDAMTRPMVTDAGREGPVSASAKAASAKAANPGRRDDDDWRRIEGYAGEEADETRWRAPEEGWVRDPETNTYVPMQEYLARWAPPKARILGVGGLGGSPPRDGVADSRRSAKDREDALRRIRREWNDANYEVRDVRGDRESSSETAAANSAANSAAELARRESGWGYSARDKRDAAANLAAGGDVGETTANRAEDDGDVASQTLMSAASESARVPIELESREARAARVRRQSEAARRLRERRAKIAAKEAAEEKLYREMTARQDARLAEAKMRKEDDDRALELFRLRAENDLLKARLDRIFYDRLIAPGELVRDERMSPAKAGRLLERDASPRRGEPEPNPGSRRPRARVFRGSNVRDGAGDGGGTVYDVEPFTTNAYPGSFRREIEARRADIADRTARKREMGSRLAERDA